MRCRTHGRAFTLYPPGHVPYGREAIAPVSHDGGCIRAEDEGEAWASTVFSAALDAAEAEPWCREDPTGDHAGGGSERWWSTQGRRLDRLTRLVGVSPGLDTLQRQRLAEVLAVSLLLLLEHAKAIAATPGYRTRGLAVRTVLGALPVDLRASDRLVAAGHLVGLWGPPYRWDDSTSTLRSLYRDFDTRGPPASERSPERPQNPDSGLA